MITLFLLFYFPPQKATMGFASSYLSWTYVTQTITRLTYSDMSWHRMESILAFYFGRRSMMDDGPSALGRGPLWEEGLVEAGMSQGEDDGKFLVLCM